MYIWCTLMVYIWVSINKFPAFWDNFLLAFKTDIILKRLDPLHAVQYDPLWDSFTFRTRIYDNVMNIGHAKNFDEFDM